MTPKRFKAVCTETGREFGAHEINRHIISLPSHDAQWFSWDQITVYEDIEDFISKYNPELCQSTGLTDSRGQEVYEGDVLCDLDGSLFAVIWSDKRAAWAIEYLSEDWDKSCQPLLCDALMINQEKVIGNRFMPQAELQARAEAVSNDKS